MTSDKAPTPSPDASPESRTDAMPDAAPETTRAATPDGTHDDKNKGDHVPPRAEKQAAPVPPAGRAEKFFQALCCLGPLVLLAVLAAQAWPDFWQGWRGDALYCPAEAVSYTHLDVYKRQSTHSC